MSGAQRRPLPSGGSGSVIGTTLTAVSPSGDATGANDTAAVSAALTAGDVLLLSTGNPFYLDKITYTATSSRRIIALGAVTIVQTDASGVFELAGAWDDLGSVSSIATAAVALQDAGEASAGNTTVSRLTMPGNTNVTRGDIVKVVSTDTPTGVNGASHMTGEYSMVAVTGNTTTVTLSNVLIETYATAIKVARLHDISFEVSGPITFDTDPAIRNTTVFGAVVEMRAAKNCLIKGVEFKNSLGRAIGNFTYCSSIEACRFRALANRPSKSQFGYGVQDGGWQLRMSNCHGENLRHMYAEGNDTALGNAATDFEYYGGGFFAHVSDCTAMNCQGQAFDTHPTAYGTQFTDCEAFGSFVGADSGGQGFTIRGRNITMRDCLADGCFVGFTISPIDGATLENCQARRCRSTALSIGGDGTSTSTTPKGIRINGGVFESVVAQAALLGLAGFTTTCSIKDATFRCLQPASGGRPIEIRAPGTYRLTRCLVDLGDVSTAVSMVGLQVTDDAAVVRVRGLDFQAEGAAFTGMNLLSTAGGAPGVAADIDIYDLRYAHGSVNPTILGSAFTNVRHSYDIRSKSDLTDWTGFNASRALSLVASAGGVVPIADKLDEEITVRLTGTAGDLALANLPTTNKRVPGQRVNIRNDSNGIVTLNTVAIPAAGFATFCFHSNGWK